MEYIFGLLFALAAKMDEKESEILSYYIDEYFYRIRHNRQEMLDACAELGVMYFMQSVWNAGMIRNHDDYVYWLRIGEAEEIRDRSKTLELFTYCAKEFLPSSPNHDNDNFLDKADELPFALNMRIWFESVNARKYDRRGKVCIRKWDYSNKKGRKKKTFRDYRHNYIE